VGSFEACCKIDLFYGPFSLRIGSPDDTGCGWGVIFILVDKSTQGVGLLNRKDHSLVSCLIGQVVPSADFAS
jgi:hypothetical protein